MRIRWSLHWVFLLVLVALIVKLAFSVGYSYRAMNEVSEMRQELLLNDLSHIHLALWQADQLKPKIFQEDQDFLKKNSNSFEVLQMKESAQLPSKLGLFLMSQEEFTSTQWKALQTALAQSGYASFSAYYPKHQVYFFYQLRNPSNVNWLINVVAVSMGLVLMVIAWWFVFAYYEKRFLRELFNSLVLGPKANLEPTIRDLREKIEAHYAEKQLMLSALSHDIKTPLTEALLQLELLKNSEVVSSLRKNLNQIHEIIQTSLEYAKTPETLEKKSVDWVSLLENLTELYQEKKCPVHFSSAVTEQFMEMEPSLMRRLIQNLIENALRYALSQVELRLVVKPGLIQLFVEDDGPGVPKEKLNLLGRPYYRVDQSRSRMTGGSGLGLAIVKKIAKLHEGEVEFMNREPQGFCVKVSFKTLA